MKKPVAFIGTKFGHDTILQACEELGIEVAGWFDKYYAGNTESFAGYPILGSELDITEQDKEKYNFFLASAYSGHHLSDNPEHNGMNLRKERIKLIKEKNLPLINIISPSAFVHRSTRIGKGVFLGHNTSVRGSTSIGDFVYMCQQVGVGEHVDLHDNVILMSHAVIAGNIIIEENAFIGLNATIANAYYGKKMTIGRDAKIAAGAVVYKDVEPNKFVSVEGRRMRKLDIEVE
jgi:sugar O-acyltransferase (sialic acid O-acetyltransferase NeuD family)